MIEVSVGLFPPIWKNNNDPIQMEEELDEEYDEETELEIISIFNLVSYFAAASKDDPEMTPMAYSSQ